MSPPPLPVHHLTTVEFLLNYLLVKRLIHNVRVCHVFSPLLKDFNLSTSSLVSKLVYMRKLEWSRLISSQ